MNNISSFTVLMVLGGSLLAVALYYLWVSIQNLFSGHFFRGTLKHQVTHARLGAMLTKKDIDLKFYLFSPPDAEIMKHIPNHCINSDRNKVMQRASIHPGNATTRISRRG
jgi:hypothetical protein